MEILSLYEKTELVVGIIFFFIFYAFASNLINGYFNLMDVVGTTVIFGLGYYASKLFVNYYLFNYYSTQENNVV